jgi:hypothetical protein
MARPALVPEKSKKKKGAMLLYDLVRAPAGGVFATVSGRVKVASLQLEDGRCCGGSAGGRSGLRDSGETMKA